MLIVVSGTRRQKPVPKMDFSYNPLAMIELRIMLPEDLAERLKAAGLLHQAALEKVFREALRRHGKNGFYAALDEIATINLPAVAQPQIRAENDPARAERGARQRK
jgi:post-segregation antitoxin (ccd killing protein)